MVKHDLDEYNVPPHPWAESEPGFKERLHEDETWSDFLLERAAYRFRGLSPAWANRLAQQHYPPAGYPILAFKTGIPAAEVGLAVGTTEFQMRDKVVHQLGIEGHARSKDFEGRKCSFSAAIEWVAENLAIKVIQQDSPSKAAWSIYQWAVSGKANTSEFYRMYLSRRYRPDLAGGDDYDPSEGLSAKGEDIGLSAESGLPGPLRADSDGPAGEPEVAGYGEPPGYEVVSVPPEDPA